MRPAPPPLPPPEMDARAAATGVASSRKEVVASRRAHPQTIFAMPRANRCRDSSGLALLLAAFSMVYVLGRIVGHLEPTRMLTLEGTDNDARNSFVIQAHNLLGAAALVDNVAAVKIYADNGQPAALHKVTDGMFLTGLPRRSPRRMRCAEWSKSERPSGKRLSAVQAQMEPGCV